MSRTVPVIPGCLLVLLIGSGGVSALPPEARPAERVPEIEANCWFNAQPVRLHDRPRLVLLEFWSVRSRESRQFVGAMTDLHEAFGDKGLLVVALTSDDCKDTEYFLRRETIGYKVGAESRTPKVFQSNVLPDIVLIDLKELRVAGRWSGREVKAGVIARAIGEILGPPPGNFGAGGTLLQLEAKQEAQQVFWEQVGQSGESLSGITSEILNQEGEISAEALSMLDAFYNANLPDDPEENNEVTRAQSVARGNLMFLKDMGYGKLFASGRLNEAAKQAIQDRVLQIAQADPSSGVRISAFGALGRYIGKEGDNRLLDALRRLLDRETDPMMRAAIDGAMELLDPARAGEREDLSKHPIALNLRRMLKESPDPAASPWADAHVYIQTVAERTTEQLWADYWAFPDPPDDETGRQNATLKRHAALYEIKDRLRLGEIGDLQMLKDQFARALREEADPYIRKYIVWSGLKPIAERGGAAVRAEIIDLLEKRLPVEPHRNVRAPIETALKQLKGN